MTTDDPDSETQDSERISGLVSDVPAIQDTIGFDSYTNALAAFLLAEETEPPLTVSVEGSWGTGKSSFMRQLRKRLEANGAVTVEFNAWRHESNEDLWAGFVKSFIPQVVASRDRRLGGLRSAIRLYRLRLRNGNNRLSLISRLLLALGVILIGGFAIFASDAAQTALLSQFNLSDNTIELLVGRGSIFVALAAVLTIVGAVMNRVWSPLRKGVATAVTGPEQDVSESFRAAVLDDFDQLTDAYLGDQTAYVFVDDLDRMAVPKAAELLREINLYLGESSQIIFIFGMDREKVAAGLAASNEPVLPFLTESRRADVSHHKQDSEDARGLEFGLQYLEKFVQVPVRVPKPDLHSVGPLFERTDGSDLEFPVDNFDAPSAQGSPRSLDSKAEGWQKLIQHISKLLENNPRKIKSFGNLYRLHGYLAAQEGMFDTNPPLTPPQLAKYVALAIQYPQLVTRFREYPDLIQEFEEYDQSDDVDPLCEPWIHYESVQALFQHEGDDEIGSSTLTEWTLIQLSRVAPTLNSDLESTGTDTETSQGTASQEMDRTLAGTDIEDVSPEQERLYHDLQRPLKFGHEFTIKRGASLNRPATKNQNMSRNSNIGNQTEDLCAHLSAEHIQPYNVRIENTQLIEINNIDANLKEASLFDGPMVVVRSNFTTSNGIAPGYICERLLIGRDILVLQEPEDSSEKLYAIVGILRSKLLLFYYLIDENIGERTASTISPKVVEDFPLPEEFAFEQLTEPVKRLQDIQATRNQTPPDLKDFLGGYDPGKRLGELGELPPNISSILTSTAAEHSNLRIGAASIERTVNTVQVQLTVRYRPGEAKEIDTDQWGYTETGPHTALVCRDLDSNLADLIEAFVPVAVEEAGGFAGFRSTATKTQTPLDRLQEITLPALADVVAGLKEYQQALDEYEQAEIKQRDIQNEIDQVVYDLYDLSDEQIDTIENSFVQQIYN